MTYLAEILFCKSDCNLCNLKTFLKPYQTQYLNSHVIKCYFLIFIKCQIQMKAGDRNTIQLVDFTMKN